MTAEEVSFDDLYRREYASLVRVAYVLVGRRAVAEEIVQEAFLRAHRQWSRVGSYERPGAWLRRVVLNLATSTRRRMLVEARVAVGWGVRPAGGDPELSLSTSAFWRAVRSLPRRQAEVVALYYAEDLSVADIAAVLGTAEGTVRAQLHQARAALARTLAEDDGA